MPRELKQDTLADICQKIRDAGIPDLADHIEAAWRREKAEADANALAVGGIVEAARHKECGTPTTEKSSAVGNAAAMREALVDIGEIYREHPYDHDDDAIANIVDAALSAPPRQCDVGTPEEQKRRFNMFCKRKGEGFSASAYCAYECPCGNQGDCKLAWAQTPYEAQEGAGK